MRSKVEEWVQEALSTVQEIVCLPAKWMKIAPHLTMDASFHLTLELLSECGFSKLEALLILSRLQKEREKLEQAERRAKVRKAEDSQLEISRKRPRVPQTESNESADHRIRCKQELVETSPAVNKRSNPLYDTNAVPCTVLRVGASALPNPLLPSSFDSRRTKWDFASYRNELQQLNSVLDPGKSTAALMVVADALANCLTRANVKVHSLRKPQKNLNLNFTDLRKSPDASIVGISRDLLSDSMILWRMMCYLQSNQLIQQGVARKFVVMNVASMKKSRATFRLHLGEVFYSSPGEKNFQFKPFSFTVDRAVGGLLTSKTEALNFLGCFGDWVSTSEVFFADVTSLLKLSTPFSLPLKPGRESWVFTKCLLPDGTYQIQLEQLYADNDNAGQSSCPL